MKIRKLLSAVLVLALLAGMVPGALMEEVQSAAVEESAGEAEAFDIAEEFPAEEELPVEEALSAEEEVPAEAVEAASEEVALELSGDFIEVKAGEQAPAARNIEETISGNAKLEMTTLDTLHIAVSGVEAVQSWTTGTRKVVPEVSVEDGVAVVKAIAAGKATLNNCPSLGKYLELYGVDRLKKVRCNNSGFEYLEITDCGDLTYVNAENCPNLIKVILKNCDALKQLWLTVKEWTTREGRIDDKTITWDIPREPWVDFEPDGWDGWVGFKVNSSQN